MLESPKISIIMAAYNAEAFVSQAIQSVMDQSLREWELICVDDGSTDNTWSVLQEFSDHDSRISCFGQKNGGPAAARCEAIGLSRGEFVFQLDADDLITADLLENCYLRAKECNADCVVPDLEMNFNKTDSWSWFQHHQIDVKLEISGSEAFLRTFPWQIHGLVLWKGCIARKLYVPANTNYSRFNSDEYMTRLLFLNCQKVVFCDGTYRYRAHEHSITKTLSLLRFDALETNRRLYLLAEEEGLPKEVLSNIQEYFKNELIHYQLLLLKNRTMLSNDEQLVAQRKIYDSQQFASKKAFVLKGSFGFLKTLVLFTSFTLFINACKIFHWIKR